jgi:pyruvate kinase
MNRRAKIVATIGPASQDEANILRLLQAGVNVARLNFSHGTYEDHAVVFQRLRTTSSQLGIAVAVMMDLQGPKIRTGDISDGQAELVAGQTLILTTQPIVGDSRRVGVDYPDLPAGVQPGGRILLDDGNLELSVVAVHGDEVETTVTLGGILKPHKGVNLPGARINLPGFTEKDRADLAFGLQLGVDIVAVSFVRTPQDIHTVRGAIQNLAPEKASTPVIAKLERPEALDNLEEIVDAADGVMVARGDLGVEMRPETVPIAQKRIIECANRHAKVVITATQMLDSMIHNPRPTRAEASDVANAILDGTDAVMLSGETATGKYPIQAVEIMNAIVCQAEANMEQWGHWHGGQPPEENCDDTYFMTLAARELAHDRNVAAIASFTRSGRTALLLSKARPDVPISAYTPDENTYHRMAMYWGVVPHRVRHVNTLEEMIQEVDNAMLTQTTLKPGQQVVMVCGYPVLNVRPTNLALLHTIGEK